MKIKDILEFGDNNTLFDELCLLCTNKSIVPFVGAGLSIPPYSSWRASLEEFFEKEDQEAKDALKALLDKGEYQKAADYVHDSLEVGEFERKFLALFDEDKIAAKINKSLSILPDIFSDTGIITLNFDRCIEHVYKDENIELEILGPNSNATVKETVELMKHPDKTTLWKLHGDYKSPSKRVFTSQEYDRFYKSDRDSYESMKNYFADASFLFLGCSLSLGDKYMDILSEVASPTKKTRSYAFLKTPSDEKERNRIKKELSKRFIFPIWYPNDDAKHESVFLLLTELDKRTKKNGILKSSSTMRSFTTKSIPDTLTDELRFKGINIKIPQMDMVTIDDIVAMCLGRNSGYSRQGLEYEIYRILGEAYDVKYSQRKISKDVRGLAREEQEDYWVDVFERVLCNLGISKKNYYASTVLVVGVGNGDEGLDLEYDRVAQQGKLLLADIAQTSLEIARKKFIKLDGNCEAINQPAQDLSSIPSDSIDLYISTMTFQSTFFNIEKALYEAVRVLNSDGSLIISVVNGYLNKKKEYIKGMMKYNSLEVDTFRPRRIADHICDKLKKLGMNKIGTLESDSEIFVYATKKLMD